MQVFLIRGWISITEVYSSEEANKISTSYFIQILSDMKLGTTNWPFYTLVYGELSGATRW